MMNNPQFAQLQQRTTANQSRSVPANPTIQTAQPSQPQMANPVQLQNLMQSMGPQVSQLLSNPQLPFFS